MAVGGYDTYVSPLASRNASEEMLRLWSPRHKFNTWRRIWLAVAEAQHEMGLPVSKEQVEELRGVVNRKNPDGSFGITDDEIRAAEKYERELRHDVMAHVHALGDSCPKARAIIHLGMTSQDVNDNAELETLNEARFLIRTKLIRLILDCADAAVVHRHLPALALTHFQAAQPITMGRRFAQHAYDLWLCLNKIDSAHLQESICVRGLRGATGTQASYLQLLDGDSARVDELEALYIYLRHEVGYELDPRRPDDEIVAGRRRLADYRLKQAEFNAGVHGYQKGAEENRVEALRLQSMTAAEARAEEWQKLIKTRTLPLVTQTYPRVLDCFILSDLAATASVLHKIATDIRLLCGRKELDEPFEEKQIGSSAMPYKRNPMRCERVCGLARFVMNLVGNAFDTAATQWLERTLDDSSNRRLSLPEAFLALDGALDLMHNVASGLIVHEAMVRKNLMDELPFLATENILMECAKGGGDRQEYHEKIRVHAQAAGLRVKDEGLPNDLIERLKSDKAFWSKSRGGALKNDLNWDGLLDPLAYVGRSVEQTERFIKDVVEPLRERHGDAIAELGESGPKV